jgi:hypothetical protein
MTFTNAEENRPALEVTCRLRVWAQCREALLDEFERSGLRGAVRPTIRGQTSHVRRLGAETAQERALTAKGCQPVRDRRLHRGGGGRGLARPPRGGALRRGARGDTLLPPAPRGGGAHRDAGLGAQAVLSFSGSLKVLLVVEPCDLHARKIRVAPEALAMLTDGVDLRCARLRPWYERD